MRSGALTAASLLLAATLLSNCDGGSAASPAVIPTGAAVALDLDGRPVHPLRDSPARFVLLLFTRTDCPISNRYAPEIRRLHSRFAPLGVEFVLVYADPEEPVASVRRHLGEYGYPFTAVRDASRALARLTGATVTPEAALVARGGALLYLGQIDDRAADFGKARYQGARRDLEDALDAAISGRPIPCPRTEAVGCSIPEPPPPKPPPPGPSPREAGRNP
jgi:hypothetical protein